MKITRKKIILILIVIVPPALIFLYGSLWLLTISKGVVAVKKIREAELKQHYESCKKYYKKDPKIGLRWSTPQIGISQRRADFWKQKLFVEKQYPSYEEWRNFHVIRNKISCSVSYPLLIEVKHYNGNIVWMKTYYFWYLWGTRNYKRRILVFIN